MSSSLRDIRRRLHSVENIKKITLTMERIAVARLRHAQTKAEQSRPYISKLKQILRKVAATGITHPLFDQRKVKKTGVVIFSADRGLSGSYNSTIFSAADSYLKKFKPDEVELILIGRKAVEHYKHRHWKIRQQLVHWTETASFHDVSIFSNQLVNLFLSHELDEVWLIYTHFISILRRQVVIEKFLNIGKTEFDSNGNKIETEPTATTQKRGVSSKESAKKLSLNYIFEPSPEEILTEILPRYCITHVQTALFEAYASELGARIVAMQTASKNSDDMITRLTLIKNKTRQRDITREMIEITTGAEGLK